MKSASRLFVAALLVGLALRLFLLLVPTVPFATKATEPTGDSPEYVRLATNLAHRHTFSQDSVPPYRPDILRTPVYPLFLAVPLLLTDRSSLFTPPSSFFALAVFLQLLLSLAIVWLTLRLGLELGLEPSASALAALLVALSPNLVFYSVKLTTETLFLALLLTTLHLVNRFRVLRRWQELVAAGVGCGLLILTRPIALFLPVLIALYVSCRSSSIVHRFLVRVRPSSFIPSLILVATTAIVLAPWVIRNRRVSGSYTLSTAFDYNISEYTAALTMAADRLIPVDAARDSLASEAEQQFGPLDTTDQAGYWAAMAKVGWQEVKARPLLAAKVHAVGSTGGLLMPLSIRALRVFAGVDPTANAAGIPGVAQKTLQLVARGRIGPALALIWRDRLATLPPLAVVILLYAVVFHFALLIAVLAALFLRRSRRLLWLLLPILYFVLTTGPVSEARFRVPIEPLLCLFAAVALTRVPRPTSHTPLSSSRLP
jgi:hypothetical protein